MTEPAKQRSTLRFYFVAALLFSLGSVTAYADARASTNAVSVGVGFDPRALEKSRALIGKKKSLGGISESTIIEYFQAHPEALRRDLSQVIRELNAQPKNTDTTKHVRLIPPAGKSGYEDLQIYVSHPYRVRDLTDGLTGDKLMPADNLVQVLVDSIRQAKKEIALNVYEFDLDDVATALIEARKERNITVRVGVDARPLNNPKLPKPRQVAIVDRLRSAGIEVSEVDSAKINHQKMIAIDWSDPALARAVFSSGNFTRSCLDPKGDLADVAGAPALKNGPKREVSSVRSIPNANHIITMKSWIAANLIQHEFAKIVSKDLGLRGRSFPTSGAFQITGPAVDPQTFEAYPENSFIIAFTPGGGNRDVNKNILAHLLRKSEGPVRMTQFAFSSKDVAAALLERAERDVQKHGKFDFVSVGDTPFAMQKWSQFLKMSGLMHVSEGRGKKKRTIFSDDPSSAWRKSFSDDAFEAIRKNIRIAPIEYGSSHLRLAGEDIKVSAKIHHKIMSMGDFAVVGTSFNFSEGAEGNNEQVLVFRDPKMAAVVRGITDELANQSPRSVAEEALRRNEFSGQRNELPERHENSPELSVDDAI